VEEQLANECKECRLVRDIAFALKHGELTGKKPARRIVEIVSTVEPVQDGRIDVELINGPFLFKDKASPAEYGASMKVALKRSWLVMHESGTFVRFTLAGAELFA
jgi:hypothetical protein